MSRDDVIRMARKSGAGIGPSGRWLVTQDELERFAALVVADAMVRGLSTPIVVKTADIDPELLRDMLAKQGAADAHRTHQALEPFQCAFGAEEEEQKHPEWPAFYAWARRRYGAAFDTPDSSEKAFLRIAQFQVWKYLRADKEEPNATR